MTRERTTSSAAMWRMAALCAALVMSISAPGWAQTEISGSAKSVKLRVPDGEELIVESVPEPLGSLVPFEGDELIELSGRLVQRGRLLATLLDEAGVDDTFFKEAWRQRADDAMTDLQEVRSSVDLAQPPPRYAPHYELVYRGGQEYRLAIEDLRSVIETDQPLYSPVLRQLAEADALASEGLARLRRERRTELAENPAPAIDPLSARQSLEALCASRTGSATAFEYDRCVAAQGAAVDAMNNRHSFTEGVDEPTFNSIRNRCRDEFRADFVARDRCERQRLAAGSPASPGL
jgi:hypothetical protein